MPRIAHVISIEGDRVGGAARVMLSLLDGGREREWEQVVLNPYASNARGLADHCPGIRYETLTPHTTTAFPRARRWLRRRLDEFEPDLVHAHLLHASATVATLRHPWATVLTHHHSRHLLEQGRQWAARLDRGAGRRFDRVVACSESVRRFLVNEYGYPTHKVDCILNGWSGSPIHDGPKPEVPTVVCVANFRPKKRHDLLLEAFRAVRAQLPDARLMLLGDGPLLTDVQRLALELNVNESVEFAGSVNVWPRLARAHVFVLCSTFEGLPVALLEAMAAGLPVVATAVDGNTDVVRPTTGFLVPPDDIGALTDRILELLLNPRLREQMGSAGREAAEWATMDRCVSRYFELYERLLRLPSGG